jgi:transposase
MSHEIRAEYGQMLMFPPCVEDWVPANHPARFIRAVVDAMDLEAMGFKQSPGKEGRPHYAQDLLLKVWLYGYCTRIRSLRGLEKGCLENIALIWLTGNNAPDHNTLWRFFRDNKKPIRKVFKHSVRIALKANLVGMVLHALDGTKIHAAATGRNALSKKQLEKALKDLERDIDELERDVEQAHREEMNAGWALPQELSDARALQDAVLAALQILEEQNIKTLSAVDGEARVMKTPDGQRMSYNAQAVADDQSALIVGADVVNDANDMHQLAPMLERTGHTLDGAAAEQTVADAGYDCPEQIAAAQHAGHEVLLPQPAHNEEPFHTVHFMRDIASDTVTCPMGRTLEFVRERQSKSGHCTLRVYHCKHSSQCPHASQCTQNKRGRYVELSPWHEMTQALRAELEDPDNRCKLKRRRQIIEPVFAAIKERFGFRRFTVHGLENVKTQWSLACSAYNLMKLYTLWRKGDLKLDGVRCCAWLFPRDFAISYGTTGLSPFAWLVPTFFAP